MASRTNGSSRHDRKIPIDTSTKEYIRQKTACSALSVPRTQQPSLSEEEGGIRRERNRVFDNATIFSIKTEEGARLTMTQQGHLTLWDEDLNHSSRGVARLMSEASLVLPDVCAGMLPSIITKKECGSDAFLGREEEVLVRWGPKESPYALLHVIAHHRDEEGWHGGMTRGWVLEFTVRADAAFHRKHDHHCPSRGGAHDTLARRQHVAPVDRGAWLERTRGLAGVGLFRLFRRAGPRRAGGGRKHRPSGHDQRSRRKLRAGDPRGRADRRHRLDDARVQ